jgi:tetratricopeptide (TPR) repeat protein
MRSNTQFAVRGRLIVFAPVACATFISAVVAGCSPGGEAAVAEVKTPAEITPAATTPAASVPAATAEVLTAPTGAATKPATVVTQVVTEVAEAVEPESKAEAAPAEKKALTPIEVFQEMLPSTAWVRVTWSDDAGNTYYRTGTGWVYDVEKRLVVTNEHVVHDFDDFTIYFPQTVDGELVHDPNWYVESGQSFSATVIDRDTERDLAILQLEALPESAVALSLAEKSPVPGERVFALAGLPEGSEGLWIMTSGEVRQVYKRSHANNHFARVVETQLPTNRGNSGGAVVNDRLEVVAVVEGHMIEARLVSLFIDVNEIRAYLEEVANLVEPDTAEEFETRASRRYDEARYDQAISDYSAALRIDPKLTSAMINRGWAYTLKEDYETAKADFDAALKIDPEMRGAYTGRGTSLREQGKFDEAIADFTEAIRRDATDADTYERRAKCYFELGRHEEALKDRNRAVELAPDSQVYMMGRGQSLRMLRRFDESRRDFEKAIALDPGMGENYYELGYVYFDQGLYDQAALFFTMAHERDPSATAYLNMRGMAHTRMERYSEAAADYAEAIRLAPQKSLYYWQQGMAMWNLDRYQESLDCFSKYIELEPQDPTGYKERADVYEAMGQTAAAEADRRKYRELGGKDE